MAHTASLTSEQGSALTRSQLKGLLLPITTPFAADESLDLDALRSNVERWNATGVSGYVVGGSTGERVHLSESEYIQVLTTAREAAAAEHLVIAGAGQQSTIATIREIQKLNAAVALDAVLVITPHFYRPAITQAALIEHYHRVADASPVAVILYSMPPLTGITIESETAARLAEHENIVGIKDSSADVPNFRKTVGLAPTDFAVLTGNGTILDQALSAGATGAILAVGCVAPELCLEIVRALDAGDSKQATHLQSKLTPLARAVTTEFGIGGLKTAMTLAGYAGGFVRAPLAMPVDAARQTISNVVESSIG